MGHYKGLRGLNDKEGNIQVLCNDHRDNVVNEIERKVTSKNVLTERMNLTIRELLDLI